jgi:phage/plasmid-like protein (TIGR03299 family)
MSHNVEKMMFAGVNKPWWYGNSMQDEAIGVDLGDNAVTSEVAMKMAGIDWLVSKRRSAMEEFTLDGVGIWTPAENEYFLARSSDNSVLGRCAGEYVPFQNAEAFEFLDTLVLNGDLLYHTAGSLEGGKRVWIMAQTPTEWIVRRRSGAESPHKAFILAMLGHTGNIGISLMATDVAVVCANTAGFADSRAEGDNLVFRIPHKGDIKKKLGLAAIAIEEIEQQSGERREMLQAMAQASISTDAFIDFATSIFLGLDGSDEEVEEGVKLWYETAPDRAKTIMENKVGDVTQKFLKGIGNEGETLYDAMQGFTEFFDHFSLDHVKNQIEKGKRAAKAVTSSWVGAGAERKKLVYKRLTQKVKR